MEILETKQCASRNDVIYFVLKDQDHIKEIHYRSAVSCNDDLIIRDYMPPQYHARYVAIGKKAAERRAADKTLNTQIRWGEKDIKIFVKIRSDNNTDGEKEHFRKTSLQEFMQDTPLPDFDMELEWKVRKEEKVRKKLVFGGKEVMIPSLKNVRAVERPTSRQNLNPRQTKGGMLRQHSYSSRDELKKRQKRIVTSSESSDGEIDQTEDPLMRQDEVDEEV